MCNPALRKGRTMANFLNMRCPKCGDEDRIDIRASVWIRVTSEGTDADTSGSGTHDYEPMSVVVCRGCDHPGTVWEFEDAGSGRRIIPPFARSMAGALRGAN
jgi:ribosomal protein S27E